MTHNKTVHSSEPVTCDREVFCLNVDESDQSAIAVRNKFYGAHRIPPVRDGFCETVGRVAALEISLGGKGVDRAVRALGTVAEGFKGSGRVWEVRFQVVVSLEDLQRSPVSPVTQSRSAVCVPA